MTNTAHDQQRWCMVANATVDIKNDVALSGFYFLRITHF